MAGSKASSMPMMKSDADYMAEDDHRTMSRAAEIQNDPRRMQGVKKQHRKVTKQQALVGRAIMKQGR